MNIEYLRVGDNIKQFFEENIKEKLRVLTEELTKAEGIEDKTTLSRKNEHLEWFEGMICATSVTTNKEFFSHLVMCLLHFYRVGNDMPN